VPTNTKNLLRDLSGLPIPQMFDPVADNYTPLYGADGALLINSLRMPWREDFPGTALDTTNNWDVVQQGSGQTIAVANSELTIGAGTTANQETILRSKRTFTIPFRVWFIYWLSQRVANQEFYLEVVDASGNMVARWLLDGTTATTGKSQVVNAGVAAAATARTITTSASYAILEIELAPDECTFVSRAVDSTSQKSNVYCHTRLIPDPLSAYYVQIRAKNLATAPASNTNLIVDAVVVQDIAELTAEITAGRGQSTGNQAVGVYSVGGIYGVSQSAASSLRAALGIATSGGVSAFKASGVGTTTQTVKSSAGLVYGWVIYNPNSSVAYVQFHNTTTITPGTTSPLYSVAVPPGGVVAILFDVGITHGTAIAVIATTTMLGGTAPTTGLDVNVFYA
jgi:hypothetical protein